VSEAPRAVFGAPKKPTPGLSRAARSASNELTEKVTGHRLHEACGLFGLWLLRCLTFELSWHQQQNARLALQMMIWAAARAWHFAVGAQLE